MSFKQIRKLCLIFLAVLQACMVVVLCWNSQLQ